MVQIECMRVFEMETTSNITVCFWFLFSIDKTQAAEKKEEDCDRWCCRHWQNHQMKKRWVWKALSFPRRILSCWYELYVGILVRWIAITQLEGWNWLVRLNYSGPQAFHLQCFCYSLSTWWKSRLFIIIFLTNSSLSSRTRFANPTIGE